MPADILIVGHGICGTWLGYYLEKAGISFEVIDKENRRSASRIASGVINPITGRRLVKTWLIDLLLPFCKEAYATAGKEEDIELIRELPLIDFHSSLQRKNAFSQRIAEGESYLETTAPTAEWKGCFEDKWGYGIVKNCQLVQLRSFIDRRRKKLREKNQLWETSFDTSNLKIVENRIEYQGSKYRKLIFCDGAEGFHHPWFSALPFAACKGEALWLHIPGLPPGYMYKKGITLVPWEKEIFWVGSSYEWSFQDDSPTKAFYERSNVVLKEWLNMPFEIVDHQAAVRPATLERRPFVGFLPLHPQLGILNGMGTKGCSLAPYFAQALTEQIVKGTAIHPEADIVRFKQLLSFNNL